MAGSLTPVVQQTVSPNHSDVEGSESNNERRDKDEGGQDQKKRRIEENVKGNKEEEEGEEEARQPRGIRKPEEPSKKEIEEHQLTHWPYRSWCIHCQKGKATSLPHRTIGAEEGDDNVPLLASDYMYMSTRDAENKYLALVMACKETEATFAHVVPEKGTSGGWIVGQLKRDIDFLGWKRVVLKSDQEPSIVEVHKEVKKAREEPTTIIHSPVGESQSNGRIERRI